MKLRILLLCVIMLPMLANAEVYKWKDKDGSVRYTDVPPPSNIKQEPMYGKKIPKPTGQEPLAEVEGDVTAAANKDKAKVAKEKAAADKTATDNAPMSKEGAAAKRAKDAEQLKIAEEQKQADLKLKQDNCQAAKANLVTYTNGGRITKINEKGEREYLGDADMKKGMAESQADVEKYCN